jgi:hypothetical protein
MEIVSLPPLKQEAKHPAVEYQPCDVAHKSDDTHPFSRHEATVVLSNNHMERTPEEAM